MIRIILSILASTIVLGRTLAQPALALRQEAARVLALPKHGHSRVTGNDLEFRLCNVVIDSGLLWFHLRLYNRSHIAFHPAYCRFVARGRPGAKRQAQQSIELSPFRRPLLGVIRYRHPYNLLVPFRPFALAERTRLLIQVGEASSGRILTLSIPAKRILRASYIP